MISASALPRADPEPSTAPPPHPVPASATVAFRRLSRHRHPPAEKRKRHQEGQLAAPSVGPCAAG
jgi:hypothetical protein